MAHSKSRWADIARRRDAEKAAAVDDGCVEIGDIAGWERRVEEAIERGDPFVVLRHLKPEEVRYPGLGRRLADAVLGPFLALKAAEELRSPKCLVLEEHRCIWGAVEALGLVPLVRRIPGRAAQMRESRPATGKARGAAEWSSSLVVDLREYATHGEGEGSEGQAPTTEGRQDDEVSFS
jgi:hypothetical protein